MDRSKNIFGVSWVPKLKFKYSEIPAEAQKLVGKMSISGVQPKLSMRLDKKERALVVAPSGGTYILKPSPEQWPNLAENEAFCMDLAGALSIEVPLHTLLPLADKKLVYIVRRFDRLETNEGLIKVPVEDFAQLLEAKDKYSGSAEQIGKFIVQHSDIPFIDTQKLFIRLMFYFLIGNGDAHLKNFSMVRLANGYRLAPAYDIVSSRLAIPNESEEMAITINSKKSKLAKKDFDSLAGHFEIGSKVYKKMIEKYVGLRAILKTQAARSSLDQPAQKRFITIFEERFERLKG